MKKETELKSVNDRIEQESGKVKYENKKDILKKRFHKVYFLVSSITIVFYHTALQKAIIYVKKRQKMF